jgi:hypothetical protein
MKSPDTQDEKSIVHIRLDRIQHIERTIHRSQGRKKEEIWTYKQNHANIYIQQMLEAEQDRDRRNYVIRIYDEAAFQRIREKQWHPNQVIRTTQERGAVGEITFPDVASWMEIKKWVLGWGSAVELIKPTDKRQELWEEIKAMCFKRYGGGM